MTQGWICVHRQLLEWEWFSDHNTFRLFVYFMLKANHQDKKWKGILIKRGQHLTSLDAISAGSGLTKSQVRTSIKKLKSTHEIAHESNKQHTVITVINYSLYQGSDTQVSTRVTHESHTNRTRVTPNNNDNNENNDKNKERSSLISEGFDHFWKFYKKKADKKNSFTKFKLIVKKMDTEGIEDFVDMITKDCKKRFADTEKEFVPNATTYLNGERWNDEIIGSN